MVIIREINDPKQKSNICNLILRALPDWFGVEASIIDYANRVQTMLFWTAFDNEKPIGFISIQNHNRYTSEICVMGILKEYHRQGIGKKLFSCCEKYCIENKIEYLTVKTLDASASSKSYEKTRAFYLSVGFRPLEVFPSYWDKNNPCLLMGKFLGNAKERENVT